MRIMVQKFGGSSVATATQRERVCARIQEALQDGFSVVVVVSAMGRVGDPYATDTLINLTQEVYPDCPKRELDLLLSCGEIISSAVLAAHLLRLGYNVTVLSGREAGIITDNNFGDARVLRVIPTKILELLKLKKIVIVAGFQGVTEEGEVTTLGRGGSDTTACALGIALGAEVVDIFTDVQGIMTADPRIVEKARLLDQVTYYEICHLAHQGAKVIHPHAVEMAMQNNIPLRVRSTFVEGLGTLVSNGSYGARVGVDIRSDRLITGITHIAQITQLQITINQEDVSAALVQIFQSLARAGISVDFINIHPEVAIFTVADTVVEKAVKIMKNLHFEPQVRPNCAKISVVGAGMAGIPGVMATIVEALGREQIPILQSTDSHTTIWCLVDRSQMERAVRVLHQAFQLDRED
ncbi:MAG: aspartate kinase [Syntrophomonadaceae bacterium]|nr:aspartate kinase [Syntrophomonadaceae bacterium]